MDHSPQEVKNHRSAEPEWAPLLEKIAAGDDLALIALYDETGGTLFGLLLAVLRDRTAAEEALLDVFTHIWRQSGVIDAGVGDACTRILTLAFTMGLVRLDPCAEPADLSGSPADEGANPPLYLRDLLAARIEREAQTIPQAPAPPPLKTEAELQHVPLPKPAPASAAKGGSAIPWILATGLLAAAAFVFFQWRQTEKFLDQSIAREKERIAAAQEEAEKLRALIEGGSAKAAEIERINAILASPGVQVIFLAPQSAEAAGSLAAFWDSRKSQCIVTGQLPAPTADQDYQLWFFTAKTKVSMGLLEPGSSNYFFKSFDLDPGLQKVTSLAVTLEPKGGSEQPTTRAVLLGKAN